VPFLGPLDLTNLWSVANPARSGIDLASPGDCPAGQSRSQQI